MPSDPQDEEYCPERESPSEDDVAFVNEAFEDVVIDINAYTARPRQWTAADFSKARAPYAYDLENDTNNLYFHTKVQEDAFFGHLVDKNVFKHQTIDFGFMSSQPTMSDVVTMLQNTGLKAFLEKRCDWNNTVIRQFYATVEVDFQEKTIEWMTGKVKYEATFADFARANSLNYASLTDDQSFDIVDELELDLHGITYMYEPAYKGIHRYFGHTNGLKHHPAVLNKISRATIIPKSYKENFLGFTRNFVHRILHGYKVDVVNLIMEQLSWKKTNLEINIYFAPYIQALINLKAKFKGPFPEKHKPYRPFNNDKAFLARPVTPRDEVDDPHGPIDPRNFGGAAPGPEAQVPPPPPPAHGGGPYQWEPPQGYFDPFFNNLQTNINANFQSHFEAYGQQLDARLNTMQQGIYDHVDSRLRDFGQNIHDTVYDPIMTRLEHVQTGLHSDMEALDARFNELNMGGSYGGTSSSSMFHDLEQRQQHLEDDFSRLNTSFSGFSDHFYSIFPAPAPPPSFYPHHPYYPPPPPPQDDE